MASPWILIRETQTPERPKGQEEAEEKADGEAEISGGILDMDEVLGTRPCSGRRRARLHPRPAANAAGGREQLQTSLRQSDQAVGDYTYNEPRREGGERIKGTDPKLSSWERTYKSYRN